MEKLWRYVLNRVEKGKMDGDKYQFSTIDVDYIKCWMNRIFVAENDYHYFTEYAPELIALPPDIVALIVNLCTKLNLSTDIEFSCFDTFDLYFCCNFDLMQRRMTMMVNRGQVSRELGWIVVKEEFLASFERSILSIVSLVTKFFSGKSHATSMLEKLWQKLEHPQGSSVTLADKELEVLKVLHYKVCP